MQQASAATPDSVMQIGNNEAGVVWAAGPGEGRHEAGTSIFKCVGSVGGPAAVP